MVLVVVGVAACSVTGASHRRHPTFLVTHTSLGGIRLRDSEATVERLYGHGRNLRQHGSRAFHYPAGLTVYYDPSAPESGVAMVEATSSRFHTASGVHLGGSARTLRSVTGLDCGVVSKTTAFSVRRVECLTHAYGPGLRFDLVGGKVVFLALVERTN
jgi:hypothetical protein